MFGHNKPVKLEKTRESDEVQKVIDPDHLRWTFPNLRVFFLLIIFGICNNYNASVQVSITIIINYYYNYISLFKFTLDNICTQRL